MVNQITPSKLYRNKDDLESFLEKTLSPLIGDNTWMTDWKQIAQRFKLFSFQDFSLEESLIYQWNEENVEKDVLEVWKEVKNHLSIRDLTITIVPALPFTWFEKYDQSLWVNGFTNGVGNVLIAVPPKPDEDFLKYMIAHELHHATPENPIYKLMNETISLLDWYKFEGGAEYFSLSLYPDKRWWKKEYTPEVDSRYQKRLTSYLLEPTESEKNLLCYGNPSHNIPYLAGYAFAYHLFVHFFNENQNLSFSDLFFIESLELYKCYSNRSRLSDANEF